MVNALIHRDYNLTGQKCQLVVDANTIIVKSPGGPIPPITLDQMRSFVVPIKSRNPILHYVFARMKLAEEMGYGLLSLRRHAERLGLPLPTFSMEGDYLVLTIYRSKMAATAALGEKILEELSSAEKTGWEWLSSRTEATQAEYSKAMDITARTAQRHIKKFLELGLLRRVGASSSTRYEVTP